MDLCEHYFMSKVNEKIVYVLLLGALTEVYRYPSLFMARYKPVFAPWIATIRRPTGIKLNCAKRGEQSGRGEAQQREAIRRNAN